MNPLLSKLPTYTFGQLAQLTSQTEVPTLQRISLSLGEPKHALPDVIKTAFTEAFAGLSYYPTPIVRGTFSLREAIATWLESRYKLPNIDPATQIIPVNGSREALFSFAQSVIDPTQPDPQVLMPNPYYEAYEGAAILAGATPVYINCTAETGFLPNFETVSEENWRNCQLLYICTPNNPCGTVLGKDALRTIIQLADKYDFIIASDECYSEIYLDEDNPPTGLLETAADMGRVDFDRCVAFYSLSKRSNVPGLRSGFLAGDAKALEHFELYRIYHSCSMSPAIQLASEAAWRDEKHVKLNRQIYREKFAKVYDILSPIFHITQPEATFYLWLPTPLSDIEFTRDLYKRKHVEVLPGSYLSRPNKGENPGENYVRIALVATIEDCVESAERIRHFMEEL